MTAPNRNTLWARALVEELARHGLQDVCVGSGSRSAPLVEAFARDERFRVHPHVDERSAAFFALGAAAASGTPAAVVTTSGTATANLFPAVIEASQSDVPLLVLTADRPARLRGLDANQTIDQTRLYGDYPRLAIDLPDPPADMDATDVRGLRVAAARAWAAATGASGGSPGPVHVNVRFEKPLEPVDVPGDVPSPDDLAAGGASAREDERPFTVVPPSHGGSEAGRRIAGRLADAERPLVVCGPTLRAGRGEAALRCAASAGAPLLADPLSGARFAPGATDGAVAWADAVLGSEVAVEALRPDLVLRVGPAPTSAAVGAFLEALAGVPQIVLDDGARWKDHAGVAMEYVHAPPAPALDAATVDLEEEGAGASAEWRTAWCDASAAAGRVLGPLVDGDGAVGGGGARAADADDRFAFEGALAAAVARAVPDDGILFIGNSMPIRDVDAFARPSDRRLRALGFRGASGIDGNVSGALGACAAMGSPVLALLGDLTLLHDVGALLSAAEPPAAVQIVVVQNRGGGIFHMLPIREFDPPFTRHVVMPHEVDMAAVAEAARIPHRLTASSGALARELEAGWKAGGIRILEVPFEREDNMARRRAALDEAARAVTERLAGG